MMNVIVRWINDLPFFGFGWVCLLLGSYAMTVLAAIATVLRALEIQSVFDRQFPTLSAGSFALVAMASLSVALVLGYTLERANNTSKKGADR